MNEYQLIVIGAGPGGYEAAIRAAQLGLTTALVENRQVGGTCLNRGCIPTKALLHAAALYRGVQEFESVGLCAQGVSFDIQKVHHRKNQVIEQLRSGIEQLIKANKIDLYQGTGTLTGPHSVTVATGEGPVELTGENILVATGSKPSRPPIPGLDLPHVGTSDEFLFLEDKLYENLIIIGGGVIGVEFASVYQSFGCKVTIVEAMDRILPPMDREISQNLAMILKKRGVAIHTGAMVERLEETPEGIACHFTQKGKEQVVTADGVLVAIGRPGDLPKPCHDPEKAGCRYSHRRHGGAAGGDPRRHRLPLHSEGQGTGGHCRRRIGGHWPPPQHRWSLCRGLLGGDGTGPHRHR